MKVTGVEIRGDFNTKMNAEKKNGVTRAMTQWDHRKVISGTVDGILGNHTGVTLIVLTVAS